MYISALLTAHWLAVEGVQKTPQNPQGMMYPSLFYLFT